MINNKVNSMDIQFNLDKLISGDIVFIRGKYHDYFAVYKNHKQVKEKDINLHEVKIKTSVTYYRIGKYGVVWGGTDSIRIRHSTERRVLKADINDLDLYEIIGINKIYKKYQDLHYNPVLNLESIETVVDKQIEDMLLNESIDTTDVKTILTQKANLLKDTTDYKQFLKTHFNIDNIGYIFKLIEYADIYREIGK